MNQIEELKYRTECVKNATNNGYGEKRSLASFLYACNSRIGELTPLVREMQKHPERRINQESDAIALKKECETLIALRLKAEDVISNPNLPGVDIQGKGRRRRRPIGQRAK